MRKKIWKYKKQIPDTELKSRAVKFGIPPVILTILNNRGITAENQIKAYFSKSMANIHNPMLMHDMEKAAERIKSAVENKEKIVIYGDYDVDGITSTAVLYLFLTQHGADVSYYIPDRITEGYGMNIMAVNKFIKDKVDLVITVDCGITAIGEVEFAKLSGLDIIITDHHTCKEKIPDAYAVVNAKKPDCEYPFKELSGVGVAFKLILAVVMKMGLNTTEYFKKYCDIAAIGTIADVVPLEDENRVIVDKGLEILNNTEREGIKAIFEVSGVLGKPITSSTIAYAVSPRLNAAGRLSNASTAVKLLLESDKNEAYKTASELNEENRRRQLTEQEIFNEAMEMIDRDKDFEKKKVIVLANCDWHNGVIGIVASRIVEKFYKPCILITYDEKGVGKGSGRSIEQFNLFEALSAVSDDLAEFGGHSAAAGLSINIDKISEFEKNINAYADKVLSREDMVPVINIDTQITAEDVSLANAQMLAKLEPYGMGNAKPVFSVLGLKVITSQSMGLENKHLRVTLISGNKYINAVGFGMGDYADKFNGGDIVDVAFTMEVNEFQGSKQVQLQLKDIKMHT